MANEIAKVENATVELASVLRAGPGAILSTIQGDTQEARIANLEVFTNSESISEILRDEKRGKLFINLANFIVQNVELTSDETGEISEATRVILVDADGSAYHAISAGLVNSLQSVLGFLGHPATWENPVPVKVVEKTGKGARRYMTLRINPEDFPKK